MRVYQRTKGGPFYLDTTISGKRIVRSTGTSNKKLATEYAHKLQTEAFKSIKLDGKPQYTFSHVVQNWLLSHGNERKSIETIKQRIKWLHERMNGMPLGQISRSQVETLLTELPAVSNATKNRYVAEVCKLMHHAKALEWIENVPAFRRYSEGTSEGKWLTRDQATALAADLPPWLAELFWFALATGLRESNVRLLEWDRVNLDQKLMWVTAKFSKTNKTFGIPLSDEAVKIIEARKGKCATYVFGNNGEIPGRCSRPEWYVALKKHGLQGFRWHELRHTWASWHVMAGTPIEVLQELGAWTSPAMLERYAHLSQSYVSQWANNSSRDKSVTSKQC